MNWKIKAIALTSALMIAAPAAYGDAAATYDSKCASCHGKDGKGNQNLGAPDLTDADWMYGSSDASLRRTIMQGRHGVMPPHADILGDTRARVVGAYVWSLSQQQAAASGGAGGAR